MQLNTDLLNSTTFETTFEAFAALENDDGDRRIKAAGFLVLSLTRLATDVVAHADAVDLLKYTGDGVLYAEHALACVNVDKQYDFVYGIHPMLREFCGCLAHLPVERRLADCDKYIAEAKRKLALVCRKFGLPPAAEELFAGESLLRNWLDLPVGKVD